VVAGDRRSGDHDLVIGGHGRGSAGRHRHVAAGGVRQTHNVVDPQPRGRQGGTPVVHALGRTPFAPAAVYDGELGVGAGAVNGDRRGAVIDRPDLLRGRSA